MVLLTTVGLGEIQSESNLSDFTLSQSQTQNQISFWPMEEENPILVEEPEDWINREETGGELIGRLYQNPPETGFQRNPFFPPSEISGPQTQRPLQGNAGAGRQMPPTKPSR